MCERVVSYVRGERRCSTLWKSVCLLHLSAAESLKTSNKQKHALLGTQKASLRVAAHSDRCEKIFFRGYAHRQRSAQVSSGHAG